VAEFKEIGRIKVSTSSDVVLSSISEHEGKIIGYSISKFITAKNFTGFAKGTLIPVDNLPEFLALFPEEKLKEALQMKTGRVS
jgi:hypothetical protein